MRVILLSTTKLKKTYRLGRVDVPVLRSLDLRVAQGEWVAVLGKSGSGKSTLLHLLGGLDRPDRNGGTILFRDEEVTGVGARRLNRYRNRDVGFVFQFYHLLPELTVLENTLIGAMVRGRLSTDRKRRAHELLELFELNDRLKHRPRELSGGERQRVAIARSLINDPPLLLADEPTGNLDQQTGESILDVLSDLHARGQTIVMVTHDEAVATRADRSVHLADGRIA